MKLQRQVAYKYKGKTHYKFVVIIPENMINELGWKEGQELKLKKVDSILMIEKEEKH